MKATRLLIRRGLSSLVNRELQHLRHARLLLIVSFNTSAMHDAAVFNPVDSSVIEPSRVRLSAMPALDLQVLKLELGLCGDEPRFSHIAIRHTDVGQAKIHDGNPIRVPFRFKHLPRRHRRCLRIAQLVELRAPWQETRALWHARSASLF